MFLLKPSKRGTICRMLAAADAPTNRRVNLPDMIAHQVERHLAHEASANAALAPMAQLPVIRMMRALREVLTR